MALPKVSNTTTFKSALPYGAISLTAGVAGSVLALACAATAFK